MSGLTLYFAYGSNLNVDDFDQKCGKNAGTDLLRFKTVARWEGMRLKFSRKSTNWKGGALDIVPAVNCSVTGVVFEVTPCGRSALDEKEKLGKVYREITGEVVTKDGERYSVFSYQVLPNLAKPFVPPSPMYLQVVRAGYEKWGLDMEPLERAARG